MRVDALPATLLMYARYFRQLCAYKRMGGDIEWKSLHPILGEASPFSSYDPHYLYQDAWAVRRIVQNAPSVHIDVGSRVDFVAFLSCILPVVGIEYRPLRAVLDQFFPVQADLLHLPLRSQSCPSLSCLHVAEHVGLGRYGDPLNPLGTAQAMNELNRVLAPKGNLYFSVPVGKSKVCFNAHRILSPLAVLEAFSDLKLEAFAAVTDDGCFREDLAVDDLKGAKYACGLFHFVREDSM